MSRLNSLPSSMCNINDEAIKKNIVNDVVEENESIFVSRIDYSKDIYSLNDILLEAASNYSRYVNAGNKEYEKISNRELHDIAWEMEIASCSIEDSIDGVVIGIGEIDDEIINVMSRIGLDKKPYCISVKNDMDVQYLTKFYKFDYAFFVFDENNEDDLNLANLLAPHIPEFGIWTVGIAIQIVPCSKHENRQIETKMENLMFVHNSILRIDYSFLSNIINMNYARHKFDIYEAGIFFAQMAIRDLVRMASWPNRVSFDTTDMSVILKDAGKLSVGFGEASGDDAYTNAAKQALECLTINGDLAQVKRVIFNVDVKKDNFSFLDVSDIVGYIESNIHEDADLLYGITTARCTDDFIQVVIIASTD